MIGRFAFYGLWAKVNKGLTEYIRRVWETERTRVRSERLLVDASFVYLTAAAL